MTIEIEPATGKRPIGVWVITCFYFLSFCIAAPSMIYAIHNHPEFLQQFSTFEIIVSFVSMAVTLIAVVFLFRLRAISFWIFLGVALISLILPGIRFFTEQEISRPEHMGYGVKIFELAVWLAIMLYIWILKSRGILK